MIRFRCPTCDRECSVAEALARLPLLCKGCGHQLTVPEASLEPEPPPPPPTRPAPAKKPPAPTDFADDEDEDPLFETNSPDIDFDVPPPPGKRRSAFMEKPPPPPPDPPPPAKPAGGRKALGFVVDAMVVLLLLAGGVFLGELVAQKPTRDVMESASGPKFPPLDLLMWLAPPVVLMLVYALLGSRGKTVGGWLRRRGR